MTVTGATDSTASIIDLNVRSASAIGRIIAVDYSAATTLTGSVEGVHLDLGTNVTGVRNVTGVNVTLPSDNVSATRIGYKVTSAATANGLEIGVEIAGSSDIGVRLTGAATDIATTNGEALVIESDTTGTITIGGDSSAESLNFGTGSAAKTLIIGSTNTTSSTSIQSGSGNIAFAPSGTGVIVATLDSDSNVSFNGTVASDVSINLVDINITATGNAGANSNLVGLAVRNLNETGTTGTPDSLIAAISLDANETVGNGLLIEQNAPGGIIDNGILISATFGIINDGIQIGNGSETIINAINIASTGVTTDIILQNGETLNNNTNGSVTFTGIGGTNNESFTIDLDSAASSGATLSSGGSFVLINDNLSVGIDGNTTENINETDFAFSGNDLYVADKLGVQGNAFIDGTLDVDGAITLDGAATANGVVTANTDVDLIFGGTENLAITSDLAGSVNVVSIIGTPSSATGTTNGIFIQQANSANTNGLDVGLQIENSDADLPIGQGILINSAAAGGFTDGIQILATAGTITDGIQIGSGSQTITNAINIASTGVITDIILQNGETIDNNSDGTVLVTATIFQVSGSVTVGSSLNISAGALSDGSVNSADISDGTITSADVSFSSLVIGSTPSTAFGKLHVEGTGTAKTGSWAFFKLKSDNTAESGFANTNPAASIFASDRIVTGTDSLITNVVADIMRNATVNGGVITLSNHGLKAGERVKLIFEEGNVERVYEVLSATPDTFTVDVNKQGGVFAYGREVDDFHIVDYEAIAMLNVSATQELASKLDRLEEQQKIIAAQQKQIESLQAEIKAIRERLASASEAVGLRQ